MPSSPDEYELLEEVGVGATASVWLARVKTTGLKVAIKLVDLEAQGNGMVQPPNPRVFFPRPFRFCSYFVRNINKNV